MKILLTGGLGFIGSHFVTVAEAAGHEVYILDACAYSARSANLTRGRRWHECDINDLVLVEHHLRTFRPDWVVNMAAETHVGRSIGSRQEFLRANVSGVDTLLTACLGYWKNEELDDRFRVLQVSTDEVFGDLRPKDPPWTEASPYRPNNPYAASKAAGDHLARAYFVTHALPVIVTHASNNYGTHQHPEKLIPALMQRMIAGLPMQLHGDGRNVRDWLNVRAHCQGLLAALRCGVPGRSYAFGGNCERSNYDLAMRLWTVAMQQGLRTPTPPYVLIEDRAGNDRRYSIDITDTYNELGWHPGMPIEHALPELVSWYIDNQNYSTEYGR